MADVFLSYASEDRPFARRLAGTLIEMGWSVWWDRKIPPGLTYVEVIEHELSACRSVVVIWSTRSVSSHWVRTEANEAFERRILIPVRMDDAKLPLEFRHLQTADLTEWSGSTEHPEFIQVVARLQQLTDMKQASVRPWPATGLFGTTQTSGGDGMPRSDPDGAAYEEDLTAVGTRPWLRMRPLLIAGGAAVVLAISYTTYLSLDPTSSPNATPPPGTTTSVAPTVAQVPTTSVAPAPHGPSTVNTDRPELQIGREAAKKGSDPAAASGRGSPAASSTQPGSGVGSALVPPHRNSAPNTGPTAKTPSGDGTKPARFSVAGRRIPPNQSATARVF